MAESVAAWVTRHWHILIAGLGLLWWAGHEHAKLMELQAQLQAMQLEVSTMRQSQQSGVVTFSTKLAELSVTQQDIIRRLDLQTKALERALREAPR